MAFSVLVLMKNPLFLRLLKHLIMIEYKQTNKQILIESDAIIIYRHFQSKNYLKKINYQLKHQFENTWKPGWLI